MLTRRGSCSHCVPASDHQGALCVSQLVNYTPIKPKHNKGRWDPETLSGPTPGFPRVQCEPHSRLSCSSCPLVSTTGTSAALQAEGTRQTRGERRPWASVRCSAPHPPGAPPPGTPATAQGSSQSAEARASYKAVAQTASTGACAVCGEKGGPALSEGLPRLSSRGHPHRRLSRPRPTSTLPVASSRCLRPARRAKGHTGTGGRGRCCGWPWGPRASPAPVTRRSFCGRQLLLSPPSQTDAARAAAALPHDREACSRDTHPTRGCAALPQRPRAPSDDGDL